MISQKRETRVSSTPRVIWLVCRSSTCTNVNSKGLNTHGLFPEEQTRSADGKCDLVWCSLSSPWRDPVVFCAKQHTAPLNDALIHFASCCIMDFHFPERIILLQSSPGAHIYEKRAMNTWTKMCKSELLK